MVFLWISIKKNYHQGEKESKLIINLEILEYMKKWQDSSELETKVSAEAIIRNLRKNSAISKKSYLPLKTKLERRNIEHISISIQSRVRGLSIHRQIKLKG